MPEPKVVEKAAEAPAKPEYMPEGDAPFSESTEEVPPAAEGDETAEEVSKEAKEVADAIEPGEGEDAEEKADELDEVDQILAEPKTEEDKSNVQKRIDKLTAELKAAESERDTLKQEKALKEGKSPEYTDAQLRVALKKALDDGDGDLAMDIMDYRMKKMEDNLIKRYEDDKESLVRKAKATQEEWNDVASAYDKYADTKIAPLYPGSHKDLNLKDGTSLLYQVAMALYWSDDPEKARYYRSGPGGQKLAVTDALAYILRNKVGKAKNPENEKLKRQLIKEKRKKQIVSGAPGAESKGPSKPLSESERLAEVIDERRKYQEERGV
jgi:hypothetical protein